MSEHFHTAGVMSICNRVYLDLLKIIWNFVDFFFCFSSLYKLYEKCEHQYLICVSMIMTYPRIQCCIIKATFENLEGEVREITANADAMKRNYIELTELKHVLRQTTEYFSEVKRHLSLTIAKQSTYLTSTPRWYMGASEGGGGVASSIWVNTICNVRYCIQHYRTAQRQVSPAPVLWQYKVSCLVSAVWY